MEETQMRRVEATLKVPRREGEQSRKVPYNGGVEGEIHVNVRWRRSNKRLSAIKMEGLEGETTHDEGQLELPESIS